MVELVQAKCAEQDSISLYEAEQIVVDTIGLTKSRKASQAVGTAILSIFGIVCVFLIGLLISEGSIVVYSVGSIITGLIAWAAPILQMTLARSMKTTAAGMVSFGMALISLTIQFFQLVQEVETGDFAAIEDTIHVLCLVVILFCTITLLVNLLMIWNSRGKK